MHLSGSERPSTLQAEPEIRSNSERGIAAQKPCKDCAKIVQKTDKKNGSFLSFQRL